ncbi:MAG: hypothetical protein IJ741_10530, partial [Schwartzia sp.]|nr:hypothetical protein [Schwartzia sp. (in: firmicutes)]
YHDDDRAAFIAGVKAPIQGDIELSNVARQGGLDILSMDEGAIIDVRGGNGAQGNMVLAADGNVGLLGNTKAAHDIMVNSANGSFSGIGRDMEAGHDVLVSAGDAVTYIGTISAGNDMDIRVTNPSSDGRGIRIGELNENETLLAAGNEARFYVQGDGNIHFAGDVIAEKGDVIADISGTGNIEIYNSVESKNDSVSLRTGKGDIVIGTDNTHNEETIKAKNNVTVETGTGTITIQGKTSTETGDITMKAGKDKYEKGLLTGNFIIKDDGKVVSGGGISLNGRNGDIFITDDILAKKSISANIAEQGSVYFETDVDVSGNVGIHADEGDIFVGHTVQAAENIDMSTNKGIIDVGRAVTSTGGSIDVRVGTGDVIIGDNGPNVDTVTAKDNINIDVELGKIYINGKTSTKTGDIALSAGESQYTRGTQSIIIDLNGMVESGRDVRLTGRNGDFHVTDAIQVKRDLYAQVLEEGGVYFDRKTAVTGNLTLAGDVIVADRIAADNGGKVFRFSATGAFPKKVIDYFRVGSLSSEGGTEMPSLWIKHGYLHVDKGDLAVDDAFAVDKIYLDNDLTNVAIFGRIPTRDGEQLVYWNNLGMAGSKTRSFQLYTDGTLRTHGAVLIDAEGNYGKLYGDNLSVVDMMRDRVSHERGKYTFDSALLTEPGRLMREPVFFGVESTDVIIQQQNASDAEIVVE